METAQACGITILTGTKERDKPKEYSNEIVMDQDKNPGNSWGFFVH